MWLFDDHRDTAAQYLDLARDATGQARTDALIAAQVHATLAVFELQRSDAERMGWVGQRPR